MSVKSTLLARNEQGVLTALLPAAAIMANILAIGRRTDGLDEAVHKAAIQCALHAMEHGDSMLADRLVKTLGGKNTQKAIDAAHKAGHEGYKLGRMTGYNVQGLVMWFARYTPIMWNGDGKVGLLKAGMKLYDQLLARNGGATWNMEHAEANPFWTLPEVRREMERQPFTLETVNTIVINLRDRFNKSVEAGTFKGDKDAALAYISRLSDVEMPEEDDSKMILPTAPNIKGTTYKGQDPAAHEQAVAEAHGADVVADDVAVAPLEQAVA
jgi:hypothetical protein